jgi:hypothetical protein
MNFFTHVEFDREDLNDKAVRAIFERYARHLKRLKGFLSNHVLELAILEGIDDGLVVSVKQDMRKRTLTLTLRCGNLQIGYYDLRLKYRGVEVSDGDMRLIRHLQRVSRYRWECLTYHELDKTKDGLIEHRFQFYGSSNAVPFQEFSIRCQSLHWETIPRENRDV